MYVIIWTPDRRPPAISRKKYRGMMAKKIGFSQLHVPPSGVRRQALLWTYVTVHTFRWCQLSPAPALSPPPPSPSPLHIHRPSLTVLHYPFPRKSGSIRQWFAIFREKSNNGTKSNRRKPRWSTPFRRQRVFRVEGTYSCNSCTLPLQSMHASSPIQIAPEGLPPSSRTGRRRFLSSSSREE